MFSTKPSGSHRSRPGQRLSQWNQFPVVVMNPVTKHAVDGYSSPTILAWVMGNRDLTTRMQVNDAGYIQWFIING